MKDIEFKVYKTKEEISNWLDAMKVSNYIINDDLTVDVKGDVKLIDKFLTYLPIQFNEVLGDFVCSQNKLITLKGMPKTIKGSFVANNNQLTSLAYFPKHIEEDINLGSNQLTSLEGLPKKCYANLDVRSNHLTSLKGCSEQVKSGFICSFNQLSSLEFGPKKVASYFCHSNQLTNLDYAPEKISGVFSCGNNKLTSLKGSLKEVNKLSIGDNDIHSFNAVSLKANEIHIFRTSLNKINHYQEIEHLEANLIIDIVNKFNEPLYTQVSHKYHSDYNSSVYLLDFKALKEKLKIEYEKQIFETLIKGNPEKKGLKI